MDNNFNGQDDNSGIFGGYNGGNNNSSFGNDYNNSGYNNNFGNDYNNNGYNNNYGNNYNNSGKSDPNIPDYIYAAHPDARMATKKDGIRQLVIVSIVSFIVLILCGALFFYTLSSRVFYPTCFSVLSFNI